MATSEVSIANMALSILGEEPIISLTEDQARARVMNLWYEPVRDAVVQSHLWNSASARQQISKDATPPDFGFDNSFQLPSNFLRLVQFNDGKTDFRIEGKKLLTNAGTAQIRYIKKLTDPNDFEPLLVMTIAARLATETAVEITGDTNLRAQARQEYKEKLQEARGVDAQQTPIETLQASDWTDARLRHSSETDIYRPIEDS